MVGFNINPDIDGIVVQAMKKIMALREHYRSLKKQGVKGADALDEIQDYFTQQITNVRQQAYQQGLEDSKKGTAHVVIQKTEENKEENTNIPQFQNSSITDISQLD